MAFDVEKLNLLEKVRDFRFALALLAFAALADVFLVLMTGSNLWAFKWNDIASRPGPWLLLVLAYSVMMTLGAGLISSLAMAVLELFVPKIQHWLATPIPPQNPDPTRYVHRWEAEKALAQVAESARPKAVEKQLAERAIDEGRWQALVGAGWVGVTLVALDWNMAGSGIAALSQWHAWTPWLVLAIPALPCVYHAWVGVPVHDLIEWPQVAEDLYQKRSAALVAMQTS
ncbi:MULTISPECIES: hypothetical protein [Xanthomonas]|uniref:2TM domain-containing protein n=1 Tax=Xanthomonas dyei TaxID=743699 RepID=A0ABZ0DD68_9XANT|nr:hypothetical protein [Xanthomonas dyei]WOB27732.1 hypothetical protein NYR99_07340 [Xanthomonas dyei]WOB55354.1 hypothetical protein NYR95_07345 [Xanthomonas dyei]